MKAAWYNRNGEAQDVMQVGDLPTPSPQPGEVLVRLATSGVNPSDVKSRRARPLADPLIVPHSDGAGVIEAVGSGVSADRVGERVWIWNGQWQRPLALGILDDHSRYCPHLQWYLSETTEDLVHGFSQGLQKCGLPRGAMSDNGSAMLAEEFLALEAERRGGQRG